MEEGRGFVDQTHKLAVCDARVEEMEKTAAVGGDSAGCSADLGVDWAVWPAVILGNADAAAAEVLNLETEDDG